MTSYLRALYNRDPAAAKAFRRQALLEQDMAGRRPSMPQFDNGGVNPLRPIVGFGQRTPTGMVACAVRCTHPACAQGCTLAGRK